MSPMIAPSANDAIGGKPQAACGALPMEGGAPGPSLGKVLGHGNNSDGQRRPRVLIAGGGVAGIEAALALRGIAGDRLDVELYAPRAEFVYRPFAVGEPFGAASIVRYSLDSLAARIGV